MLAVLSPAKKLNFERPTPNLPTTTPLLNKDIAELAKLAAKLSSKQLGKLMDISDKLADLNYQRFQDFSMPFEPVGSRPAAFAFAGDTYVGLDVEQLDSEDMQFAQDHLLILSGLYGLLRPMDLMQPYRLEMGTKLKNSRGKNLYEFWGSRITDKVNESLTEHEEKTVVNLASQEYFKSIQSKKLSGKVITPVFLDRKDGKSRTLFLFAKRARGMMARFAIQQRIDRAEGLKEFTEGGYQFQPDQSSEDRWVFERDQPPPVR
jgi:hypothetical protein